MQFERILHRGHQFESLGSKGLVDAAVNIDGACAGIDKVGAVAEASAGGVAEVEPAGVGGDAGEKGLGDFGGDGPMGEFEQVEDNGACGGGGRIDKLDIAEAVGGFVVVDNEDGSICLPEVFVE